jgi:putative radical SAM enzyme (TIGR03279 family)
MTYPTEVAPPAPGGRILGLAEGSPAARAGLKAGDVVVAVDGEPVRDILDWMWNADGPAVDLIVQSAGERRDVRLQRAWDESWGVEFDGVVFDGIRECDNACAFCFVTQLPPGLRPSLYVKDDDYRLSFLAGNFITLTNLSDDDVERIIDMRLSPLHVSVHAVDPGVRRSLMCATVEDRALEFMDTLLAGGIELHVQIVLVRGVNDGDVLQETLAWLGQRAGIASVGVVPVGVTRFQKRVAGTFVEPTAAIEVIDALAPWRERMHVERGTHWVHAADEFYLTAGAGLPEWDDYDGFPQFENGIGMTRAFIDEVAEATTRPGRAAVTLVTGELFAPVLRTLAPTLGDGVRVLAVRNRLLGETVTVAGLLSGRDIAAAIAGDDGAAGGPCLVPECAVNDDGLFLDDLTLSDVAEAAGCEVRLVSCDAAGLVSALSTISSSTSGG